MISKMIAHPNIKNTLKKQTTKKERNLLITFHGITKLFNNGKRVSRKGINHKPPFSKTSKKKEVKVRHGPLAHNNIGPQNLMALAIFKPA